MTAEEQISSLQIGWLFVQQYYTFINQSPEKLHLFYNNNSIFTHGVEGGKDSVYLKGQQQINSILNSSEKKKVYITQVDTQPSINGSILILVLGELSTDDSHQKFSQSFILASQPSGYYILNDIFRFLKGELDYENAETELSTQFNYQEKPTVAEVSPVSQPIAVSKVVPPSTAAAAEKPVLQKQTSKQAVQQPPAAKTASFQASPAVASQAAKPVQPVNQQKPAPQPAVTKPAPAQPVQPSAHAKHSHTQQQLEPQANAVQPVTKTTPIAPKPTPAQVQVQATQPAPAKQQNAPTAAAPAIQAAPAVEAPLVKQAAIPDVTPVVAIIQAPVAKQPATNGQNPKSPSAQSATAQSKPSTPVTNNTQAAPKPASQTAPVSTAPVQAPAQSKKEKRAASPTKKSVPAPITSWSSVVATPVDIPPIVPYQTKPAVKPAAPTSPHVPVIKKVSSPTAPPSVASQDGKDGFQDVTRRADSRKSTPSDDGDRNKVFVRNCSAKLSREAVQQAFESAFGPVSHIDLIAAKSMGFISFKNAEHAQMAVGKSIVVQGETLFCEERKRGAGPFPTRGGYARGGGGARGKVGRGGAK